MCRANHSAVWIRFGARRIHERTVGELTTEHQSKTKAIQETEKGLRFKLFRRSRKKLIALKGELASIKEPQVSIDYLVGQPSFLALKSEGRKTYRVFRVKVVNDGVEPLYNLKAQLRLSNQHHSYSNIDLTLDEDLPIIGRILYRHERESLPKTQTTFSLSRGGEQFVNVAMQENENGKWGLVTLCLSRIGVDNYSNVI
jgi:hypothetical protein